MNFHEVLRSDPVIHHYHRFSFLRELSPDIIRSRLIIPDIEANEPRVESLGPTANETTSWMISRDLAWDTNFFGVPTRRIVYVARARDVPKERVLLADALRERWASDPDLYVWATIPAEDLFALQVLTGAGMRLIETRVVFLNSRVGAHDSRDRHAIRRAVPDDIPELRRIATVARNPFDRFHADPEYSPERADDLLAEYAQNSLGSMADFVLVPSEDPDPAGAFVSSRIHPPITGAIDFPIGEIVLAAVTAERRSWFRRLISEWMFELQAQKVPLAVYQSQITNHAVCHVLESLGFELVKAMHTLAYRTFTRGA